MFLNAGLEAKSVASCRRGNEVNETEFEARAEEKLTSKKNEAPAP